MEKREDNVTKLVYVQVKSGPLEGHKYAVKTNSPILVGRNEEANVRIAYDEYCSRRHARIYWADDNKCYLQDLESTNGTYLNGTKMHEITKLNNNDIIGLGDTELIVLITDLPKDGTIKPEDDISYED